MITVTKTQALFRWDTLPDVLREALSSEANADFLWQTCATENIPENMTYEVARIAGHVLQGFIHPEDVAKEITEAIKVDSRTANDIQDALNKRIFAPLRAELDKVYDPLSKAEIAPTLNTAPKMFQDIGPIKPAPLPVNKMAPSPMPAGTPVGVSGFASKGASLSDVGWSKQSIGPVVKLDVSNVSSATSAPAAPKPATPAARPATPPVSGAVGEFERLNMMKKAPGATGGAPIAEPAPMILHEDTSFKATEKNDAFRLEKPGGDSEISMTGTRPQPVAKPAVLELGNTVAPGVPKPPTPAKSVVHYTEFQTSLSSVPITNAGPRNVSQITPPAPVPQPPKPPTPSVQSKPNTQSPQNPQKEQVIVKDFL